jgi:hypothetical protein
MQRSGGGGKKRARPKSGVDLSDLMKSEIKIQTQLKTQNSKLKYKH